MTKIKHNGVWKNTAGHMQPPIGNKVLLWNGPSTFNYAAENNVIGHFTLPKGKWILETYLYTIASWIRLGPGVGNSLYLNGRSYNQNDVVNQQDNMLLVQVEEDTEIYVNVYRIAAGNNVNIWEHTIYGRRLD